MTRGRKPSTGRFTTRQQLAEFVWLQYLDTQRSMQEIADAARVSYAVANKIINTQEGRESAVQQIGERHAQT